MNVLVMAPHLGTDLDWVAAVDPSVRVLDGNAAFLADLADLGIGRVDPPDHAPAPAARAALLADADVLLVGYPLPVALAARAPRLAWVHHTQAGVSNLLGSDLWSADVLLTSSRGAVAAEAIAEYAVAGVLAFARGLLTAARRPLGEATRRHDYAASRPVDGATLGVIGLGGIGREVARLGRALGMRVVATRGSIQQPVRDAEGVDLLLPAADLHRLAAESDFVVCCAQLTPATTHLLDDAFFAALRPGAVLVNVARGEEIDEQALLRAVDAGRLGGALLDVYDGEMVGRPPRPELTSTPSIVLTPHVSGAGDRTGGAPVRALFADNLRRYLAGQPLRNLVERDRGY